MRIAMFSWETLHSHAVGGIAAHVTELAAALQRRGHEVHMRGDLEQRAHQLGVAHATRFLGYHNGGALIDLYKACDAVCLPSRNEPFGISALEGWAAGKPVVASQNGGPSEFIWHNVTGLRVNASPESVGWGLGTLFTNFEWARWMGANGRRAAESTFSWDTIAAQTERCYQL